MCYQLHDWRQTLRQRLRVFVLFFLNICSIKSIDMRCAPSKDYHSTPRNTPEERRSHQHRGRSLTSREVFTREISGFRQGVVEDFALLRCYSLSWPVWPINVGLMDCPETSANDYQHTLRNIPGQRKPQVIIYHFHILITYKCWAKLLFNDAVIYWNYEQRRG
jgi:hypothetical protein